MGEGEAHGTSQGGVPEPTNSRRHTAGLGISILLGALPKMNATPKQKGYFTLQLLSAAQGSVKLEASRGGTRGRGLSVFPSCAPGAC